MIWRRVGRQEDFMKSRGHVQRQTYTCVNTDVAKTDVDMCEDRRSEDKRRHVGRTKTCAKTRFRDVDMCEDKISCDVKSDYQKKTTRFHEDLC